MQFPSGQRERRAQRGYVPQYDLGAQVIYQELTSGWLNWIGVAGRRVGSFDDVVLGLVREFTHIARRIAALLIFEPQLDKNYAAIKANSYSWNAVSAEEDV